LLQAVALLSKEALSRDPVAPARVTLAVVGNAKHAAAFATQIKQLGLEPSVVFLGQLADVGVAYQAADILVHPTLEDTFGMVVLEAMAHGLPVVVSAGRYCGIAEDLTHEINAMVLQDPTDSHVLAETLQTLMTNENLRARLGQAATGFATGHQWSNLCILQNDTYFASIRPSNDMLY
jgi:glycosyltransferase involved in cell wall biosynthesis